MFQRLDRNALKVRTKVRTGTPPRGCCYLPVCESKGWGDEQHSKWPRFNTGAVDPRVCSAWALYIPTMVFFLGMQRWRRTQEVGSALSGGCTNTAWNSRGDILRGVVCCISVLLHTWAEVLKKNVMGNGHFLYSVLIMATFTILK